MKVICTLLKRVMAKICGLWASNACPAPAVGPLPQMTRDDYLAERAAKLALMEKQGEFLDKSLLTLAGGGLGLTLTFLHDHSGATVAILWVFIGLAALVACLLAVLFSVNFSQRSISKHVDALDEWCEADFPAGHQAQSVLQGTIWVNVTLWANRVATIMLMVGLVCVSIFVASNLFQPNGDHGAMQEDRRQLQPQQTGATTEEKGAVIKPPPVQQPAQTNNSQGDKK